MKTFYYKKRNYQFEKNRIQTMKNNNIHLKFNQNKARKKALSFIIFWIQI